MRGDLPVAETDPRTYAIIGAAMEVHRCLGCGFLESVYHEAMAIELLDRGIPYRQEEELQVRYKERMLRSSFRSDFVCYDSVIVELKALTGLSGTEESQVLNYLKATGFEVGLLLNFGTASLQHKRLVRHSNWGPPQTSQTCAD
jgi:GxxExxY protein